MHARYAALHVTRMPPALSTFPLHHPPFSRAHSRNSLVRHAAGLCPVALPGVENINLSGLIEGHTAYLERMDEVLVALNLDAE